MSEGHQPVTAAAPYQPTIPAHVPQQPAHPGLYQPGGSAPETMQPYGAAGSPGQYAQNQPQFDAWNTLPYMQQGQQGAPQPTGPQYAPHPQYQASDLLPHTAGTPGPSGRNTQGGNPGVWATWERHQQGQLNQQQRRGPGGGAGGGGGR
ncbi:hypothetical protein HTV45_29395 [Streptomyces sp. CHD11]|uniref:hypothetical protein n=1 Tax=Streptomyces sp. CHD11 TaxID=2741325 RepID=UPI001BFC3754|nr:hypothetical protein [Streptomyces sp. CHD11]MBT3154939.1 hypothetical protein [Streptomyces sp. CHD11]